MKVLWAPWRMEYISSGNKEGECIFCPGKDRNQDEKRLILHVGEFSVVLMNKFPYINGHLLIAPSRHVNAINALSPEEKLDLINMVEKSTGVLRKAMNPEGFNIGLNLGKTAGAGVDGHIHVHVVPRWSGDTNYMTVFGEVRVISEHIQETYRRLLLLF
ncbi:MAG TPA: HIT domain-containing protein [Desulfatiglandales bacterium]|nr:HIT domain-containing protein [Desulfatiglandales bacterium]